MKFNSTHAQISQQQFFEIESILSSYVDRMNIVAKNNQYDDPECSINCPFDQDRIQEIKEVAAQKVTDRLKYIFLIGIGGSNLGTKAVYDALSGYFDGIEPKRTPKILFIDTVNATYLHKLDALIASFASIEEVLIVSISKSGSTAETTGNTELVLAKCQEKFSDILDRVVVITDEQSALWNMSIAKHISVLPIPALVGGRYSVLSAVGLFPLAAAGYDIDAFIDGARDMRNLCLSSVISKNPALQSAAILFHQLHKGKTIHDTFVFHPELESLGKWYRQLMGESIGKEHDVGENVVNTGITPTVSVGSTDLHSVGQLYLGGPKDKITTFIHAEIDDDNYIREERIFPELVQMITGKSAQDILEAIFSGTKRAYEKKLIPFMEVTFDRMNERTLGEFFQFKMLEMMYLGKLLQVNAFDQPNVEDYKIETKRLLTQ